MTASSRKQATLAMFFAAFAALPTDHRAAAEEVRAEIRIDWDAPRVPISPMIYGSNHDVEGHRVQAARRLGGNRLTTYNWEADASNAGKDFRHQNDRWLTENRWWRGDQAVPAVEPGTPAAAIHRFHEVSLQRGAWSLVTVPLAGFVAADAEGPVSKSQTAPSARWVATAADSGRPSSPDGEDGFVYADQLVHHLVKRYGPATGDRGVDAYSLDNEPALWHKTHPRLHPEQVSVAELLKTSAATAAAIKRVDPEAEVFGPALWGITAYGSLSKAPDWPAVKRAGKHAWFIDAYLASMRQASEAAGVRLLDVLDVHWYTEAPKGREWQGLEASRSARALHDPEHVEPNWVGEHFGRFLPLLPRLQQSIDEHFPGTRIGITEYDWPMTGTVYGGLAQAGALGAFGRHGVHFAAYHHRTANKPDRYVGAAFELFCNADGSGHRFGETSLATDVRGDAEVRAWASLSEARGTLHLVLLHHGATKTQARLSLAARGAALTRPDQVEPQVRTLHFDGNSPKLRPLPQATRFEGGELVMTLPPTSATHLFLPLPPAFRSEP